MKPVLPVGTVISYLGVKAIVVEDGPTEFFVLCDGGYENWSWELDGHTCVIVSYPSGVDLKKNEWIPTNGKKPELPDGTLVDVKFLGGNTRIGSSVDTWIWAQDGESDDITHYRIHLPTVAEALPCHECGGDGAGGEHEEDCSMAGNVESEIPESYPVSGQIFFRESSNEWVLELTGSINGTEFTTRHTQPADTRPEDVAGLPALYELAPDVAGLLFALEAARQFIVNGIEVGAIRMPDSDTHDPAHNTLPIINAALAPYLKGGDT